jgi:hypothetical protein
MKWFSLGTPVSSTNKTDRRDKVKILLKVALNIITLTVDLKSVVNVEMLQNLLWINSMVAICVAWVYGMIATY